MTLFLKSNPNSIASQPLKSLVLEDFEVRQSAKVGKLQGKTQYLNRAIALLGLVVIASCNAAPKLASSPESSPASPTIEATPTTTPTPTASPSATAANPNLISEQGIGQARLGMTLGALKQQLGTSAEFETKSPFIVDFDAIAVSQSGEVKYYILHLAGQPLGDADVIQGLFTENPDFKTAAGIGPGSSLQQAEAAYGKVTLSYSTSNESREYARFDDQPASNISFATGNGNAETAGVYPSPSGEFNETQTFRDGAKIQSVLVVCLSENCAQ
ncbi:MAG: hypothetical protein SFY66_28110 [Oculatellaceae cyanobacterium bins.114]|nr:hypothetical protein [Oculatellaceae cyanobacterium bins.114]